ncbi:ABC transporter substrate-binding protein [Saccharomonospora cyanea]|uniref:ABC transporter substrate-binding protein n=1 Tax=Saccharomonospora cyanea TaxID=40989 RepID=UPI001E4BC722|nr:ABC transporter substrate-binding protein [Saccharomonospora cyanea]
MLADVRDSGTLRVALTQANPPWNFLDDGKPAGYDVDVAHEVARRIGVDNVEFVASNFQSFIEGVRAGRFDIVISGQTITEERKQQVGFSRPYQVNGVAIFVPNDDRGIVSLSDLEGKVVAVSAGTTQEQFAREEIPGAQVKTYQNATLGLTDLARGNADAMLVSRFQGSYLAEQNDLAVKPVGKLLESEVNGMSFRKGSPEFRKEVDAAIAGMIADGTLSRISRQWLGLDMVPELKALPSEQG